MSIEDILKEKGIRVTPQRLAVYKVILQNKHISAEEIWHKIKGDFPMVSFATVYSILDTFIKNNLVKEVGIDPNRHIFDISLEPHHHFKCRVCNKVYDIEIPLCETLKNREVYGHKIENFQGYFYGVCNSCKDKEQK